MHTGAVSTNWLKTFAPNANVCATTISLEHLIDYWSSGASNEQTAALFDWFADALAKAKALRNENNYEALLIAHEYKHSYLGGSFKQLATTMEGVARAALAAAVGCYARVLHGPADASIQESPATASTESDEMDDGQRKNLEAAFIRRYVENRIVEPTRSWYGTDAFVVSKAITELMEPLTCLHVDSELDLTPLEESVSGNLFAPKTGLMDKFIWKITELRRVLDQAPAEHTCNLPDADVPEEL
jgi:hypothetical protein